MDKASILEMLLAGAKAVTSFLGLAAFALVILVILVYLVTRKSSRPVPKPVWALFAFAISVPLLALIAEAAIPEPTYRVTVGVVDPNGVPVSDAVVTSVPDCVRSKTESNWRFDCSQSSFGNPRVLTLNAQWSQRAMAGIKSVTLGHDRAVAVTVQLNGPKRGKVRGTVRDSAGHFIGGADVYFVGYTQQKMRTNDSGEFELDAGTITAQDLRLRAEKRGYKPAEYVYPGFGDANLVLEPSKTRK